MDIQPTILKLQFLYFIGMETIQHTESLCASDFLGPGPALAQGQLYMKERTATEQGMSTQLSASGPLRSQMRFLIKE